MTLLWFIVLVGVLIFVHELGHFMWAKAFGVKVLRFSLGFGPRIAGFKRGETDYQIALIPLGGYVHMLGDQKGTDPAGARKPEDEGRAFHEQALFKRAIILLAGPAMNLLLAPILYFVVFMGETDSLPPVVGRVLPDYPADGVLEAGDRIVAIEGRDVHVWDEISDHIEGRADRSTEIIVERWGERVETRVTPERVSEALVGDHRREAVRLGISPAEPLAVIGVTSPSSPAAAGGLRTFDRVVACAGRPVERWIDLAHLLRDNGGSTVLVTYLRPRAVEGPLGALLELALYTPRVATITPEPGPGDGAMRAGLESSELYVHRVRPGSPEAAAGLMTGDRLESLDGVEIRAFDAFIEDVGEAGETARELRFRRGDQILTRRLTLGHAHGETEYGLVYDRWASGIEHWAPITVEESSPHPAPFGHAVVAAFETTYLAMEATLLSVVLLFDGSLTSRAIGGPVSIAEGAGSAARSGALEFLWFMAFISINLGILNLLPIPLLDGGGLMFLLLEAISRRPVAPRVREVASLIGLVLVLCLVVLAFKNDVERHVWPEIAAQLAWD